MFSALDMGAPENEIVVTLAALQQARFAIEATIKGQTVLCLFDSGATRNLINAETANKLELPFTKGTSVRMGVANGKFVSFNEYTETQLSFGTSEAWHVDLIVAPNLVYDVILGTPFMFTFQVTMSFNPVLKATLIHPSGVEREVETTPSMAMRAHNMTCATLTSFEEPAERALRVSAMEKCTFSSWEKGTLKITDPAVRASITRYRDRFPDALPACRPVDRGDRNHMIDLLADKPLPQLAHYGFNPAKMDILRAKLQSLLDAGIIVRHDGKAIACSPGFLVIKQTKARLVGDYRILNGATRPHAQDIPTTQEIIDLLGRATIFTLSDMMSGYFQLRIVEESQHLTTFSTPLGRFKYTVTAMGLRNAGSDFQKAVRACLQTSDLLGTACFNYLDDIIIFSNSPEEHAIHVERVLEAMRKDGWYLSYDKSQVGVFKIKILGHWVEKGKMYTDPTYVGKLSEVPSPNLATNKVKALQGFLGLVGYYRRFIPNFATMATPLTNLLRKTTVWVWGEAEERARRDLTNALQATIDKGLSIYNKDRPTRIQTDASGNGLGGVLEQLVDDVWTPIAYFSKALTPAEANLVNYERELLAIYTACRKWLCYLQGKEFSILCDCNALCNIRSMSLTNRKRRVVTMLLFLGTLSFNWQHVKGSDNAFADALSRVAEPQIPASEPVMEVLPNETAIEGESQPRLPIELDLESDSDFLFSIWESNLPDEQHLLTILPDTSARWLGGSDPIPQDPRPWKDNGWLRHPGLAQDLDLEYDRAPPDDIAACTVLLQSAFEPRDADEEEEHHFDTAIRDTFDIPNATTDLAMATAPTNSVTSDPFVMDVLYPALPTNHPVATSRPWDYTTDPVFAAKWSDTGTRPSGNYHRDESGRFLLYRNQIVVPKDARHIVLADIHKSYGHIATYNLIRMLTSWNLWWPDLRQDCARFVANCATCNLKAITSGKVFGLLGKRPLLDKCQEIAVDFTHMPTAGNHDSILGIIDRATRYTFWVPASTHWTSHECFHAIIGNWCQVFGLPSIVRSDNGPTFTSEAWNSLWASVGVKVSHSDPYHPQSNGIIERSFGTLKNRLRALYHDNATVNWVDILPFVQGCHNSTTRESLGGASPAEVMFGYCPRWDRMPRLPSVPKNNDWLLDNDEKLTALSKTVTEAILKYEKEMKRQVDASRVQWVPKQGDLVFVSRKAFNFPDSDGLNLRYLGPVTVLGTMGNQSIRIMWEGEPRSVAVSFLRPCRIDPSLPHIRSSLSALWEKMFPGRSSNRDDEGVWDAPIFMDALEDPLLIAPTPKSALKPGASKGKGKRVSFAENLTSVRLYSTDETVRPLADDARTSEPARQAPTSTPATVPTLNSSPASMMSPTAPPTSQEQDPTSQSDVKLSPTREVLSMKLVQDRTQFRLKWANSTKSTVRYWYQLVHLQTGDGPPEWLINEHLVAFLAANLGIQADVVLDRLDLGDLPGFLEEALFEPTWLDALSTYLTTLRKLEPPKALYNKWVLIIQEASEKWGDPSTRAPPPQTLLPS